VKDGCPARGAKAEPEPRTLVARANVFGGGTEDRERRAEARERREYAARPLLAREAMAEADDARVAVHFDAELAAGAGSGSRRHRVHCTAGFFVQRARSSLPRTPRKCMIGYALPRTCRSRNHPSTVQFRDQAHHAR